MHQLAFDLKRGHLRTLAYGEAVLRSVPGMTGARFDLLCLIREKHLLYFRTTDELTTGIRQQEIWERLDVHKTTVCKMLLRLEEMGWIRREKAKKKEDWRSKDVFLTALGLRRIAKAMRIMFRQRMLLKYFERAYKVARPYRRKKIVQTLLEMSDHIQFIADVFGDRSAVHYEFGPHLLHGPLDSFDFRTRVPFHHLYVPPPPPPPVPKPLVGDQRGPCRPFGFTDYEIALRKFIWNEEKPRRQRRSKEAVALAV